MRAPVRPVHDTRTFSHRIRVGRHHFGVQRSVFIDLPNALIVVSTSFLVTFAISNQILPLTFIAPAGSSARLHYHSMKCAAWALTPVFGVALIILLVWWDDWDPEFVGSIISTQLGIPLYSSVGYLLYLGYHCSEARQNGSWNTWLRGRLRSSIQFALLTMCGLLAATMVVARTLWRVADDDSLRFRHMLADQIVLAIHTWSFVHAALGLLGVSLLALITAELAVPMTDGHRQKHVIERAIAVLLPVLASVLCIAESIRRGFAADSLEDLIELYSTGVYLLAGSILISAVFEWLARRHAPFHEQQHYVLPEYRHRPVLSGVWLLSSLVVVAICLYNMFTTAEVIFWSVVIFAVVIWINRRGVGLEHTISERTAQLAAANEELRLHAERKSAFFASMAHELRTPMNAIKGFTNLVLRRAQNLEDRQQQNLQKVNQASDHLLSLINDLLDLSKIEAGRMEVTPAPFEVEGLVSTSCDTVSPLLNEGVDLRQVVETDIGPANTDEGRLRQILINLLSNAIKFTDNGTVTVTASRGPSSAEATAGRQGAGSGGEDLVIAVSDTGKGISADELPTIFDEYRQAEGSESSVQKGTGLGLSITKKFAELLGGTIGVESEVGKGSRFTVRVPGTYRSGDGENG